MNQKLTARYPSNIALVKYWGKYDNQLPCNASLSMTLSKAFTETTLELKEKKTEDIELNYVFENETNEKFRTRIVTYLSQQSEFSELVKKYAFQIHSSNSFPHSAGIASSASAFASIAALFLKASSQITNENEFNKKASCLARLGSGSACRSFYGSFASWGELDALPGSSNEYAIPIEDIHPAFRTMKDAILIVEASAKAVSSSKGHALMKNHPFAAARFEQANGNCRAMVAALKHGDFPSFISITEREALSLHAMMMTSGEYYLLMKPGTIQIIERVMQFRKESGLPLCFTLDAGPNVHLLYPESIENKVHAFLEHNLREEVRSVIYDQAGTGGVIF